MALSLNTILSFITSFRNRVIQKTPVRSFFSVFIFLCFGSFISAQNQVTLDSLNHGIKTAVNDSARVEIMISISEYYKNYDFYNAVKYAQMAQDLALKAKNDKLKVKSNRLLAKIYFDMGDYKNSSIQNFEALKFYNSQNDTFGISLVHVNLGAIHDRLMEFDKALEYYFKALEMVNVSSLQKDKKDLLLTNLYNNIANIYQTKNNIEAALQYYEQTLALARQTGNKDLEGIVLNNLGKLYMNDLNNPQKALEFLTEGLKVRKLTENKVEISRSYVVLADFYLKKSDFKEAKSAALEAIRLGEEVGALDVQKNGFMILSSIEEAQKNYQASLEAYKSFKTLSDSIQNQMTNKELAQLQIQFDFEKAEQARKIEERQLHTRYVLTIIALTVGLLIATLITIIFRSRARRTELERYHLSQNVEIKNKELATNVMYLIKKNELINDVAERLMDLKKGLLKENQKVINDIVIELQQEGKNDAWEEFELRFNQVYSDFYNKLRANYSDLSPADEKLCALLRLNLSSKEIAAITKQSIKSVEVARARLRKKLNLTNTSQNLVTHLMNM